MTKSDIMQALKKQGVVAVIRGDTKEGGYNISKACIEGGLTAIEVAYTNSQASVIIEDLNKAYPDALIGAGTVLDDVTARMAIMAGAKYIVSPSFNSKTALLCNRYGVPYIPGCMTIREIVEAMEAGSEMIKLFPGSAFGPSYVSAIKSPLPQTSIMVTGGVNLNNLADWVKAGVEAVGIGGELNKLGAKGQFEEITEIARNYVEANHQARDLA